MEKEQLIEVRCTDGDCIFQLDDTCHAKEIRINDCNQCISKQTE
jgi:hypothetical protein